MNVGGRALRQPPVPPPSAAPGGVAGGSEVYRIDSDGAPRRMWTHAQDVVYAIAFDARRPRAARHRQQGQCVPHRIALAVHVAALAAGDPGHRVPDRRRRPPVRGHREYRQGLRDRSRAGDRGLHRERCLRLRHVFCLGTRQLRRQSARRPGDPGDAQRQSGSSAEELERVGAGYPRRAGAVASPPARFVQWKATLSRRRPNWIRWTWPTCPRTWSRASTTSKSRRPTTSSPPRPPA